MSRAHTFIVPLLTAYIEYTSYESRWDERKGQRVAECVYRRTVSYDYVVWC